MGKNVCSECGIENESEYLFCKNCGAKLDVQSTEANSSVTAEKPQNSTQAHMFIDDTAANPNNGYNGQYNNSFNEVNQNNTSNENNALSGNQTQNNSQYSGQQYNGQNNQQYTGQQYGQQYYGQPYNNQYYVANAYSNLSIDGIPGNDVAFFVGKKAYQIMPRFAKMEMTQTKTTWCWPAAVLGFIFGPMGSAIWFFYRKMYKIALILLAIGVVLTTAVTVMTYNTTLATTDSILDLLDTENAENFLNSLETIPADDLALNMAANSLQSLVSLATGILTGIFGYYLYKEHAVKSIRNFRASFNDQQYYRIALSSIGGVSGGMVAVGIIALILVENVASIITLFLSRL